MSSTKNIQFSQLYSKPFIDSTLNEKDCSIIRIILQSIIICHSTCLFRYPCSLFAKTPTG